MRTFEIVACSLAGGAVAAVLWRRARQRRPPNPPAFAALASSVSSHSLAARRHRSLNAKPETAAPLDELGGRLRHRARAALLAALRPRNFLWFSDLALFALCAALWFDSALLVGMAAIASLRSRSPGASTSSVAGGCSASPLHVRRRKPLYLRALSLFHLAMPPAILSMLRHRGYDRRSLRHQTAVAWLVMRLPMR